MVVELVMGRLSRQYSTPRKSAVDLEDVWQRPMIGRSLEWGSHWIIQRVSDVDLGVCDEMNSVLCSWGFRWMIESCPSA